MLKFRLCPAPTLSAPVCVRSAGHYQLPPGKAELRPPGAFLQLFWTVSGSGVFQLGRATHTALPCVVFHYRPGEPHDITAGPEGWEYRWLTLDGPLHPRLPALYALDRRHAAGPCPAYLFDALDDSLRDPTPTGELRASVLGHEILLLAASQAEAPANAAPDARTARAKAWLDLHFADARLNIAALAARFGLHRATLHRVFTRAYGVSPVQYLGRLRLRLALDLLAGTALPVAEVAVRCGLPDIAHFSKIVSRHTGASPRLYRQRHARTLLAPPAPTRSSNLTDA